MTDSRKPGDRSAVDDIERLRALILGDEKARIDGLYERVTQPESRTGDVAEVLPGAMNRVIRDPQAGPELERPIVDTIRSAIKRDTESFAEALFPVLGPAIRRAVADALKTLVQRINVAMEHSFTAKGLRWRIEAARTGVPFGQVVLRHTMVYAVQEVFLIQAGSGLILASARRADTLLLDEDAFSAMLSAIQAFVSDSFGTSDSEPLRSAELGDRTLWMVNGPNAMLACVILGTPPQEVREQLMSSLETLHSQYGDEFDEPPETLAKEPGIDAILRKTLTGEVAESAAKTKRSKARWVWSGLGLALVLLVAWQAWSAFHANRLDRQLASLFESEPGYVLTAHEVRDGGFFLAGLRDPLARPPESLVEGVDVDIGKVSMDFHPYQSLEDEIIRRRLHAALDDHSSLALELSESSLAVRGTLTAAQFDMLKGLPDVHPIIRSVDLSGARLPPEEAVAQARQRLNAPSTVTLGANEASGLIQVAGYAGAEWLAATADVEAIGGWKLDYSPLQESAAERFAELQQRLDGSTIRFSRGLEFAVEAQTELQPLARQLNELKGLAAVLGYEVGIRLEGFADGVGAAEKNREFAMNRARAVQSELENGGLDPAGVTLVLGHWIEGVADPSQRKVIVHVAAESIH